MKSGSKLFVASSNTLLGLFNSGIEYVKLATGALEFIKIFFVSILFFQESSWWTSSFILKCPLVVKLYVNNLDCLDKIILSLIISTIVQLYIKLSLLLEFVAEIVNLSHKNHSLGDTFIVAIGSWIEIIKFFSIISQRFVFSVNFTS